MCHPREGQRLCAAGRVSRLTRAADGPYFANGAIAPDAVSTVTGAAVGVGFGFREAAR